MEAALLRVLRRSLPERQRGGVLAKALSRASEVVRDRDRPLVVRCRKAVQLLEGGGEIVRCFAIASVPAVWRYCTAFSASRRASARA
jgi:hypothetical protein